MMIFPQKLSKTWNRHYWLFAVVFLLLVIFGLILPHTLYDTPWLDEAYTYQFAGLDRASDISIFETIVLTAQYDPWPPTYYITQNIWHDWMGSSLFVTNLLPAFYGLLAVAVMYQLGRLMFAQAKAGLIAAILFGLSGFAVNYFHETRGYSLMLLAWVVMVYCYWRYLTYQSQNTKRLKLYLTLAVAFALYTHTISLVFMGGIGLYHLLVESRPATRHPTMTRAKWLDMLRALINGGILWIPWLTVIVLQTALSTIPPFVPMQEILVDFLSLASNTLPLLIVPVVFLTLMRLKDNSVRFLWIWLSIAMVGLFIVNYGANSLFHPRHILPLLVIFVLLITRGLLILEQWHPSLMISVMGIWVGLGIAIISAGNYPPLPVTQAPLLQLPYETVDELDYVIEECIQEDDVVVMSLSDEEFEVFAMLVANLAYYSERDFAIFPLIQLVNHTIELDRLPTDMQSENATTALEAVISATRQVYVMARTDIPNQAELFDLDTALEQDAFIACEPLWRGDMVMALVYTQDDNCDELTSCI